MLLRVYTEISAHPTGLFLVGVSVEDRTQNLDLTIYRLLLNLLL